MARSIHDIFVYSRVHTIVYIRVRICIIINHIVYKSKIVQGRFCAGEIRVFLFFSVSGSGSPRVATSKVLLQLAAHAYYICIIYV